MGSLSGGGEGSGCDLLLLMFSLTADENVVALDGFDVSGLTVDLNVFYAEWPVPRGLDDGLRLRVGEDDCRFVIDMRIQVGFDLLRHGGDGEWALVVHQPRHQICAVAAEIEESATAVELRIGEPRQKLGADADLRGSLVTVTRDELAHVADGVLVQQIVRGAIARVPGGLVVDHDLNVSFAGGLFDGASVGDGDGERLFHHHVDFVAGADFNDAAMVECGGVGENHLRMSFGEHVVEVGVEQGFVELVLIGHAGGEGLVGFGDTDDFNSRIVLVGLQESEDVAVSQAGDGDPKGSRLGVGSRHGEEQRQEEHGAKARRSESGSFVSIRKSDVVCRQWLAAIFNCGVVRLENLWRISDFLLSGRKQVLSDREESTAEARPKEMGASCRVRREI